MFQIFVASKILEMRVGVLEQRRRGWEHILPACGNAEEINTGH